jgi:hypothetical protein
MTEACLGIAMSYLTFGYARESLIYIQQAEHFLQNGVANSKHSNLFECLSYHLAVVKGHYFVEVDNIDAWY